MQRKILLVEDDKEISGLLTDHLQQEGYVVYTAFDGEEAVTTFSRKAVDLVLLDLMLPKINGIEFLKKLRETSAVPVLILSAKGTELDKALGLGLGADDYISKPFSFIELTARIQAAIRRASEYGHFKGEVHADTDILHFQDISLHVANFSVNKRGQMIQLTSKEFQILKLFMSNPSRVFTKEQIYNLIWGNEYYGDENVINVQIRRLREKIEDDPSQPSYIKTIWGIGYKLGE